jgi:hypothetical protein
MARVSYGAGDLLYRNYFQGRRGEPKRPFLILQPVEIPGPAASVAGWDREFLEEALLAGWIPYTKSRLESIQKLTQLFRDRLSDKELGKFLHRKITEDIRKSDLLLNGLLNYFRVTARLKRTATVNILIEEALRKYRAQLKEKEVKLYKKLEKDLPETVIPDMPLRFILNSILQYTVAHMFSHETLGLLTRSFVLQEPPPKQAFFGKAGRYVEITVFCMGRKKPAKPFGREGQSTAIQRDDRLDLILRMVEETVRRNRGVMKFRVDEKEANLSVSLEFPVERRRAFYNPNDN